jgi:hypothetical protein
MDRGGVLLTLFVVAALVVWALMASYTRHRATDEQEPTDHPVHIVRTGPDDGTDEEHLLVAMCTRCEWNEVSHERDVSAQEHDLRVKARKHSRVVAAEIIGLEPNAIDDSEPTPWSPADFYTYLSVVTHGDRVWRARWLNKNEEPGVSEVWLDVTPAEPES